MQHSKRPLWKKSMLQSLNLYDIMSWLDEISENGDMYGYENDKAGYYQEYKEQFDELAVGAYGLWETMQESDLRDNWDDMTVALLGEMHTVLGFDAVEADYFSIDHWTERFAIEQAVKRIERLSKRDLIRCFRKVLCTLLIFYDLKASHDCLTAIVEELDERALPLQRIHDQLIGKDAAALEAAIANLPQRAWVE